LRWLDVSHIYCSSKECGFAHLTYWASKASCHFPHIAANFSKQICSYSNLSQKFMVGWCCMVAHSHLRLTFIAPMGFFTRRLAYVFDSLVRVTRRVSRNHFGKIMRTSLRPAYRLLQELLQRRDTLHNVYSMRDLILPFDQKALQSAITICKEGRLSTWIT